MYPIVRVPESGVRSEQLGSKPKFWYDRDRQLFKAVTRDGSGEDWAERVSADVAEILGLPHAVYELAESSSLRGVASANFCGGGENLVLGNEVLRELDPAYGHSTPSKFRELRHPGRVDTTTRRLYRRRRLLRLPLVGRFRGKHGPAP